MAGSDRPDRQGLIIFDGREEAVTTVHGMAQGKILFRRKSKRVLERWQNEITGWVAKVFFFFLV